MRQVLAPMLGGTAASFHKDLFNETLLTQVLSHTPDVGSLYANLNNATGVNAQVQAGNVGQLVMLNSTGGTSFTATGSSSLIEVDFSASTDFGILFGVTDFTNNWLLQWWSNNLNLWEQISGTYYNRATASVGALGASNTLSITINGLDLTGSINIGGTLHTLTTYTAGTAPPAKFGLRGEGTITRLEAWQ